jgi:hypothetical protein
MPRTLAIRVTSLIATVTSASVLSSYFRDGPFDFFMGGGRKSEKKYRACLEWKKKKSNITNTSKKKYRAQKISKLAILYIERKIHFP